MTLFDGIEPGTVVRVKGLRGLYRAVKPCTRNTKAFWFMPVDPNRARWHAFMLDRVTPTKRLR